LDISVVSRAEHWAAGKGSRLPSAAIKVRNAPGALNAFAPAPDLCFVFDVDPALGLSRISKRGAGADLFEQEQTLAAARRIFTDPHVSGRSDPRPDGEEVQASGTGLHRSPARSWAGSPLPV
jgi:hypothetical protein